MVDSFIFIHNFVDNLCFTYKFLTMALDTTYLWAFIPILFIEIGLIAYCLIDWLKRDKFRLMNKWIWLLVFVFIQIIGAILYILLVKNHDDNQV